MMNNQLPKQLQNLSDNKKRVIRKVNQKINDNKQPQRTIRNRTIPILFTGLITCIIILSVVFLTLEVKPHLSSTDLNEQHNLQEQVREASFTIIENVTDAPTFHTEWQTSPSQKWQLTLDGKGEFGEEAGMGTIYLQHRETNEMTEYILTDNENKMRTPKKLVWLDDNRILMTIGLSQGMVSQGGDVYVWDIRKNALLPLIILTSPREEISNVELIENNQFIYEKFIYETDQMEYNQSRIENGTIDRIMGTVEQFGQGTMTIKQENDVVVTYAVDLENIQYWSGEKLEEVEEGTLKNGHFEIIVVDGIVTLILKK